MTTIYKYDLNITPEFGIIEVMNSIDSLSRKQIQFVRQLKKKSVRQSTGLFVAEGLRTVEQVIANQKVRVQYLILDQNQLENTRMVQDNDIPVYRVSSSVFRQLCDTENTQGVMAVCRIPSSQTPEKMLGGQGMLLAMDRIQDPGNLGTVIRTAAWFGVSGILISPGTVDPFHPKVVRSTAGSTGFLPWLETDLKHFLRVSSQNGWRTCLLESGYGALPYKTCSPTGNDILVIGNEANGISDDLRKEEYPMIRIEPAASASGVESLNVAVAAGIVMAHFASVPGG